MINPLYFYFYFKTFNVLLYCVAFKAGIMLASVCPEV